MRLFLAPPIERGHNHNSRKRVLRLGTDDPVRRLDLRLQRPPDGKCTFSAPTAFRNENLAVDIRRVSRLGDATRLHSGTERQSPRRPVRVQRRNHVHHGRGRRSGAGRSPRRHVLDHR